MVTDRRVPIAAGQDAEWTRLGWSIRVIDRVLRDQGAPEPGSDFAVSDAELEARPLSAAVRHSLEAASDHLIQWADLVTPLKVFDGQEAVVNLRPVYAFARSAMEAAGAAAWVLEETGQRARLLRHLRLVHNDLSFQLTAYKQRGEEDLAAPIAERVGALENFGFDGKAPARVGYLERVKAGARLSFQDVGRVEYFWRLASAASHGQEWFTSAAYSSTPDPGAQLHAPDGEQLIEVLDVAKDILVAGVGQFTLSSGRDYLAATASAFDWLTRVMPLKDEADRVRLPSAEELVGGALEKATINERS